MAAAFLDAFKAADQGKGVACLYGNYSGDNMNVKMAVKMAKRRDRTFAVYPSGSRASGF